MDLDDIAGFDRLDSQRVLAALEAFPEQCRRGFEIGLSARSLPQAEGLESVVVLGMGGSAAAGDLVRAVVEPRLMYPMRVIRGYGPLPEWVGRNTLAVALSYSGNTEEVLATSAEAHDRGSRLVAVASGGLLAEAASDLGMAYVEVPGGLQPRAALGFLALSLLAVLARIEIIPDASDEVTEAVGVLEELSRRCHREVPRVENPAKDLALRLKGRIPIVYGGTSVTAAAAYRFKCDLNEYAKTPAFSGTVPEMNHNEIVGYGGPDDLTESFVVVMLRDAFEHERVAARLELSRKIIERHVAEIIELHAQGDPPLARGLSLIYLTQMAAVYLGFAGGVDPGPVEPIEYLKRSLKTSEEEAP